MVTHRVIAVNKKDDGYYYITKGIANDVEDPEIYQTQIYGKIIYKTKIFSIIARLMNNMYVFFFVVFIPLTILIAVKIIQIKHEKMELELEKRNKE